jgi:hypothetical protein
MPFWRLIAIACLGIATNSPSSGFARDSETRFSESKMQSKGEFVTLAFVIVCSLSLASDHSFARHIYPKTRVVTGLHVIRTCHMPQEISEASADSLLRTNVLYREQELSKLRKSPFNIQLRGGKGNQGDGASKRQRKTLGAEAARDTDNSKSKTILYQPGGAGFGKVEVVPEPADNMMRDMEDLTEGAPPMFEVNLTEMRGEDTTSKDYSHQEWYSAASLRISL